MEEKEQLKEMQRISSLSLYGEQDYINKIKRKIDTNINFINKYDKIEHIFR